MNLNILTTTIQLVTMDPYIGGWKKVTKNKGEKRRFVDHFIMGKKWYLYFLSILSMYTCK
jgi:hypothetical protein